MWLPVTPNAARRAPLQPAPKVNTYEARTDYSSRVTSTVEAGPAVESGLAEGGRAFAAGVNNLAQVMAKQERAAQNLEAMSEVNAFRDREREMLGRMEQLQGKEAYDQAEALAASFYDAEGPKLLEKARGRTQELYYTQSLSADRDKGLNLAKAQAARGFEVYQKSTVDTRTAQLFQELDADPDSFGEVLSEGYTVIEAAYPGQDNGARKMEFQRSALETMFDSALDRGDDNEAERIIDGRVGRTGRLAADISGLADQAARAQGLDPALVKAVIAVESNGDPKAVNASIGAAGLMQLMPGTAGDLGVKDRFDARSNVDGGSRYLSQMLKKYGGDLNLALMAYNWGPGNVDAWRKTGKGVDGQGLPAETRNYVRKVKAEMRLAGAASGAAGQTALVQPVAGYEKISSGYGPRNTKIAGASTFHEAVDIPAPIGTPVQATIGGVVRTAEFKGKNGNYIVIDGDDGRQHYFLHLNNFSEGLKPGQRVEQGAEIGAVGNSGTLNIGPHLDYRIKANGKFVDPAAYLDGRAGSTALTAQDRLRMRNRLERFRADARKEYKAEVQKLPDLVKDELAMMMDTGVDNPALRDQIVQAEAAGFMPKGAAEAYDQEKTQALAARGWITDPKNYGLSYPDQIAKANQELSPDPLKDAGQYLKKKALRDMVVEKLKADYELIQKDPLGFFAEQTEKVLQKELEDGQLKADDEAAVFAARSAIGRRLALDAGMGLAGLEKSALSQQQVDQYSQWLAESKTGQERLAKLGELHQLFGSEVETAFNQLGVPYEELLAVETSSLPDPRLRRAAELGSVRQEKYVKVKESVAETLAVTLVADSDFGELLEGRFKKTFGRDPDTKRRLDGLRAFATTMAMNMIESGYSKGQAEKEIKHVLNSMSAGSVAVNDDTFSIYLKLDENGQAPDRAGVLSGLKYLSRRFGDDYFWTNDGDDHFVLVSRVNGLMQTYDGARSVRVSRADANYVGAGTTVKISKTPSGRRTIDKTGNDKTPNDILNRSLEVIGRMRNTPPLDEHSLFIEAARANTKKEMEALRSRPGDNINIGDPEFDAPPADFLMVENEPEFPGGEG